MYVYFAYWLLVCSLKGKMLNFHFFKMFFPTQIKELGCCEVNVFHNIQRISWILLNSVVKGKGCSWIDLTVYEPFKSC